MKQKQKKCIMLLLAVLVTFVAILSGCSTDSRLSNYADSLQKKLESVQIIKHIITVQDGDIIVHKTETTTDLTGSIASVEVAVTALNSNFALETTTTFSTLDKSKVNKKLPVTLSSELFEQVELKSDKLAADIAQGKVGLVMGIDAMESSQATLNMVAENGKLQQIVCVVLTDGAKTITISFIYTY